ncbi:MAG TPA: hypothetical protein VEV87_09830 [Chitinophagaceae bacterium]|nr:hypothetical protein [Chitinophagaceae bacterium]
MKKLLSFGLYLFCAFHLGAQQQPNCTFKPPAITIHFGSGSIQDVNTDYLSNYDRVGSSCPTDGHYTYTSFTSNCFSDDWHTMEDHTPGDASGNMLLVNASPEAGTFFKTKIEGLKPGTTYEFGVWLMNVCRPSRKCPFPLLPNISIRLESPAGLRVAHFVTGEVPRVESPHWTQHRAVFTTPPAVTSLTLTMVDHAPGGCGNDFAMDDITFRECVKIPPVVKTVPKTTAPKTAEVKKQPATVKPAPKTTAPVAKKTTPPPKEKEIQTSKVAKPKADSSSNSISIVKQGKKVFPPPPLALTTRTNSLVKQIETEAGEIKIELYDNGEIDGDTVSIYHNNALIRSHARLSEKPITIRIPLNADQPHHELVMVANNLGSIPPNTSVMIITAGANRYEVFISSTEQKNAKVVFDLKK